MIKKIIVEIDRDLVKEVKFVLKYMDEDGVTVDYFEEGIVRTRIQRLRDAVVAACKANIRP